MLKNFPFAVSSESEASKNVFVREPRKIREDFRLRHTSGHVFENILHGDSHPTAYTVCRYVFPVHG